MKYRFASLTLCLVAMATAQVSPKAVRTASEMEPLLASLATYEFGQSREAQAQFTQFVQDSLASPTLVKQIESRLITFLQSGATAAGKQFALRELSLIGTEASIPVLTPMLLQPATAEMARFALARIPGAAVDQALRDELAKSSGSIRIGIIGSLGQRRDSKAVPALASLSLSSDLPTAEAAQAALAEIADKTALNALAAAHSKTPGAGRVSEAYLTCANHFAAQGDRDTALRVYKELAAAKEPPMVRVAALSGMANISPKEGLPALTAELESKDARVQFAAIRLLGAFPGAEAGAAMQRAYPKVAPGARVKILSVLAARSDGSVEPLLPSALKDEAPGVRVAAIDALGIVGNAASIPALAQAAANSKPPEQTAARQSLRNLKGIDAALASAIGSSQGKVKAELIAAAGDRGTTAAADAVVQALSDSDPDVRREGLRAARNIVGPAQVPTLLAAAMNASTATERRDASQALALALQKSEPTQIGSVVNAYWGATAVEPRVTLLQALGQSSSGEALGVLRASLNDPTPEIVRGSLLGLSEWSNTAPLPDLLAVAKGNGNPALRVLALRGYLKLVGLPSQRPNPESARLIAEVAPLATERTEKQTLLSLVSNYPCKESLQLAESMLKDESVAAEAKAAIEKMNRAMPPRGTPR